LSRTNDVHDDEHDNFLSIDGRNWEIKVALARLTIVATFRNFGIVVEPRRLRFLRRHVFVPDAHMTIVSLNPGTVRRAARRNRFSLLSRRVVELNGYSEPSGPPFAHNNRLIVCSKAPSTAVRGFVMAYHY